MQLNYNCLLDIIFKFEEITDNETIFRIYRNNFHEFVNGYSEKEFFYHLNYCFECNFISGKDIGPFFVVYSLTPFGHSLLKEIREENQSSLLKNKINKNIPNLFKEIGVQVLVNYLSSKF